jgi:formate hydrogenlyase subunit 3/multisubunit Na+/H+ antiporter MnhD subunit
VLAGVAAVVGLLTVYSMVKIWSEAFWKPAGGLPKNVPGPSKMSIDAWMLAPIVAMAALTVLIGLSPEPLYQLARTAAANCSTRRLCLYGNWEYAMNLFFINTFIALGYIGFRASSVCPGSDRLCAWDTWPCG